MGDLGYRGVAHVYLEVITMCYTCSPSCDNCFSKFLECPTCGHIEMISREACSQCEHPITQEMRDAAEAEWRAGRRFAQMQTGRSATVNLKRADVNAPGKTSDATVKRGTASSFGFRGIVSVELTLDSASGAVVDASVDAPNETPQIGGAATESLRKAILDSGSVEVDAVSGATVTSEAVINAAKRAYRQAAGQGEAQAVKMKPGSYTGRAKGYWRIWDLPVTVKVNESSILKIEVPSNRFEHGETEIILESMERDMFPRIIENQSIAVDATTGATVSSSAAKDAIRQALESALEAGGSPASAVENFMVPVETLAPEDVIEKDVDVLVVGLGDGGIFAMKSACETIQSIQPRTQASGLVSILGIDRAGRFGGKSALAHEGCNNNPPRYSHVINDGKPLVDSAYFREAWEKFASTDGVLYAKKDVLDKWFAESGNTVDWLYDQGFIFGSMGEDNPMVGGLVKYNICLKNNVDPGTYEDRRRMKEKYQQQMLDSVVAQGGEYLLNTEGYEIIMDGERVAGVKARNLITKQEYVIHAKAVIMNTGGFCGNQKMLDELLDERWRGERMTLGTSQDTGAMIQAALNIGAGTYNIGMSPICMHCGTHHWLSRYPIHEYEGILDGRTGRIKVWTLNNVPQGVGSLSDALCVDKQGQRYMNENLFAGFAKKIEDDSFNFFKAGTYHWTIVSDDLLSRIAEEGFNTVARWDGYCCQGDIPAGVPVPEVYEALGYAIEEGMAFKADTIRELAELIGVDPSVLDETVARYNSCCEASEDVDFGKDPQFLKSLATGPFYAVKMYAYSFGTQGGLDIDDQIRVLQGDHVTPIDGLYATGLDSMGVLLDPNGGYPGFGGVAQGWLWTSGRLAGINAAHYVCDTYGAFAQKSFALSDLKSVSEGGTGSSTAC